MRDNKKIKPNEGKQEKECAITVISEPQWTHLRQTKSWLINVINTAKTPKNNTKKTCKDKKKVQSSTTVRGNNKCKAGLSVSLSLPPALSLLRFVSDGPPPPLAVLALSVLSTRSFAAKSQTQPDASPNGACKYFC